MYSFLDLQILLKILWSQKDLNLRPPDYESVAAEPTELWDHLFTMQRYKEFFKTKNLFEIYF